MASLATSSAPDQDVRKTGSIGPPAHEVVDLRIEDPETGAAVGTDEKGELLWHGDTVTPGYYRDVGETGGSGLRARRE